MYESDSENFAQGVNEEASIRRAAGQPFAPAFIKRLGLRTFEAGHIRLHFVSDVGLKISQMPIALGKALEELLPERGMIYRVSHRVAGLGSLGRERFVALADWGGARLAREAKALAPAACVWVNEGKGPQKIFYETIITKAVRVLDPFVHLRGRWIVRRLSPHCCRIELAALPERRDEERLLNAMGFETANIHLGSKDAIKAVRRDLSKRKPDWLHEAAREMTKAVLKDWEEWRKP